MAQRAAPQTTVDNGWKDVQPPDDGWKDVESPHNAAPAPIESQPQTLTHAVAGFGQQINPIPMLTGIGNTILHPYDTAKGIYESQKGELSQVPELLKKGRYSEAIGHGLAGVTPLVGPAAARIGEQIGGDETHAPDIAGGLGAGAGLITSILAAPKVSEVTGKVLKGTGGSLVKSALGLPGKAEAYGASPAVAVLEDTRGVRPSTIARTGRESMNRLVPEREKIIAGATQPVDLQPARDLVTNRWITHANEGNVPLASQVETMGDALTKNRVTGRPYPQLISPREALDLERGFGDEFASYNPNIHEKANALAKAVRGNLSGQIYSAAPEAQELGRRIQGLIPAVERAETVSRNAGPLQRAMDRISKPTGALVPALIGKEIGGIPGLLAGLGAPEMISSPAVKMLAARTLYGTGKAFASPLGQRAVQSLPVLRRAQ